MSAPGANRARRPGLASAGGAKRVTTFLAIADAKLPGATAHTCTPSGASCFASASVYASSACLDMLYARRARRTASPTGSTSSRCGPGRDDQVDERVRHPVDAEHVDLEHRPRSSSEVPVRWPRWAMPALWTIPHRPSSRASIVVAQPRDLRVVGDVADHGFDALDRGDADGVGLPADGGEHGDAARGEVGRDGEADAGAAAGDEDGRASGGTVRTTRTKASKRAGVRGLEGAVRVPGDVDVAVASVATPFRVATGGVQLSGPAMSPSDRRRGGRRR